MGVIRFSVFDLDESSRELTRAGRRVPLPNQAFVVLWLLASRAGEVVTREELRRALWHEGTHVDFERGLNFCIATARRALGDHARRPVFIETLPTRGYRFLVPVERRGDWPTPVASAPDRIPRAAARLFAGWTHRRVMPARRWVVAAALALLFVQGSPRVDAHTRRTTTPEALAAFDRGDYLSALALDERFAEAHFALAWHYEQLGEQHAMPQGPAFALARAAVDRAIALELAPESLRLRGSLRLVADWDVAGARRDLGRALQMSPNWDLGLVEYARVLSAGGDDRRALDAIERAEAHSPGCELVFRESGFLHYLAGDFDAAAVRLQRAADLGRDRFPGDADWAISLHDLALRIAVQQARWRDARREALALAALHGASLGRLHALEAETPRLAVADVLAASARMAGRAADRGNVSAAQAALASVLAGRVDDGLRWLEVSAARREADFLFVLRDPAFSAVSTTPRYQALRLLRRTE